MSKKSIKTINKGKKLFFKGVDYSKDVSILKPHYLYNEPLINLSGKLGEDEKLSIISDKVFKTIYMNSKKPEYMAKLLFCLFEI